MKTIKELLAEMLVEPVRNRLEEATDQEVSDLVKLVPSHHAVTFPEQMTQFLSWPAPDLPPLNRAANVAVNATGWVIGPANMTLFHRAMGKLMCGAGTASSNSTVQFLAGNTTNSLQSVTSAAWTWATITNGPSINIGSGSNSATIEIRSDQMPAKTNYLLLLVNNQCAQLFAAELICSGAAYSPASAYNNTSALAQQVM